MPCSICNHPKRKDIENALMVSNYGNDSFTLKDIAEKFQLDLQDLQVHALMHSPLNALESEEVGASIVSEVKKSEANLLYTVAQEYWVTLSALGREIRQTINDKDNGGAKTLAKPEVDLYLGTGTNLKQTIESIVDMNIKVNGEQDSGMNALVDVVKAIRGS